METFLMASVIGILELLAVLLYDYATDSYPMHAGYRGERRRGARIAQAMAPPVATAPMVHYDRAA